MVYEWHCRDVIQSQLIDPVDTVQGQPIGK